MARLFGQRRVHADKIGRRDQLVERHHLDAHILSGLRSEIRIVGLHVQPHSLCARRDLLADVTQADDAEGAPLNAVHPAAVGVQLGGVALPFAVAHVLVHAHELARNRDQQADRLFGDFDGIAAGRVTNDQAVVFGCFEIHAVDADAGAANDLGALKLRNDLARQRHRAVHDDAVGVPGHLHDFGVVGRAPDRHVGIDLSENRLDQIDRHVVAAKIDYVKLTHVTQTSSPYRRTGLSHRIFRRASLAM